MNIDISSWPLDVQNRALRLIEGFSDLSTDAQEILASDAEKFRAGAREHGPLDVLDLSIPEWLKKLGEEVTDARYYIRIIERHKQRMPTRG